MRKLQANQHKKTATYAERFARAGARDRDDVAAAERDGPRDRLNDRRRLIVFLENGLDLLRKAGLVKLPDGSRNARAGERHLVRLYPRVHFALGAIRYDRALFVVILDDRLQLDTRPINFAQSCARRSDSAAQIPASSVAITATSKRTTLCIRMRAQTIRLTSVGHNLMLTKNETI